jgi:hypothetical protein
LLQLWVSSSLMWICPTNLISTQWWTATSYQSLQTWHLDRSISDILPQHVPLPLEPSLQLWLSSPPMWIFNI